MFFPFTSLSGFVLSKCLQPSFVVSFFSWHVRVTEQMCRSLRRQPPLRIWVLLTVLFLHLKGQYFAPVRWRRKSTKSVYSYRSSYKNAARIENCVQTLAQTVAAQSTKIINIEQIVGESSNNITKWINNLWEESNIASTQETCQNSLQSRFCVGQTRIRNKSQMSGLCGPVKRRWYPL